MRAVVRAMAGASDMSDADRSVKAAARHRAIVEGLSRAARKAGSATDGAERLTDSVLMRLARFRWGALLVVLIGVAFAAVSETTFQGMQREREEIDASRLSLAALNNLVYDNAQATATEARYTEEPSPDHLAQHLATVQRLAEAGTHVLGWAARRGIDEERVAVVKRLTAAESEELKRLRALPQNASPVEVMDAFLPPVVDQNELREALEPLVRTERAYLEEQMTLLGVGRSALYQWKAGKVGPLDRHVLERLSYLFGIYAALQLLLPQGRKGPAFMAYPNFNIYLEWNQSFIYTTSAAYFATRFGGAPVYQKGNPEPGLDVDQMTALQTKLQGLGHDVGKIDGILGAGTRVAVQKEQQRVGLPADGWPTPALLNAL